MFDYIPEGMLYSFSPGSDLWNDIWSYIYIYIIIYIYVRIWVWVKIDYYTPIIGWSILKIDLNLWSPRTIIWPIPTYSTGLCTIPMLGTIPLHVWQIYANIPTVLWYNPISKKLIPPRSRDGRDCHTRIVCWQVLTHNLRYIQYIIGFHHWHDLYQQCSWVVRTIFMNWLSRYIFPIITGHRSISNK